MDGRDEKSIKIVTGQDSSNSKVFLSILSDDPEIRDAAQREGFVVFFTDDLKRPAANSIIDGGADDCHLPTGATSSDAAIDDNEASPSHTGAMNDTIRDLEKTLSGIESRMDRRIERLESDAERRSDDLRRELRLRERSARRESLAQNEALKAHIESNDKAVAAALSALARTEGEFGKVKQANKEQRYWMAGIGVAIVLGIMGANATIFGGGKSFFDSGKEALENQQKIDLIIKQAQEQTEANRRILDEIRAAQLAGKKT